MLPNYLKIQEFTYTGSYPKRYNMVSTRMAGIHWKRKKQMSLYIFDLFMDPPGYQATPGRGILCSTIFLPMFISSSYDTSTSLLQLAWNTLFDLQKGEV